MSNICLKRRLLYDTALVDYNIHVIGTPLLELHSLDISTNTIACAGNWQTNSAHIWVYIYMGMESTSAGGIEISAQLQCIDCTAPPIDDRRRMLYAYNVEPTTDKIRWYVAANGSIPNIR